MFSLSSFIARLELGSEVKSAPTPADIGYNKYSRIRNNKIKNKIMFSYMYNANSLFYMIIMSVK